jgi:hypothetical protein
MPRGEPKNALIAEVEDSLITSGEFERPQTKVMSLDSIELPASTLSNARELDAGVD